MSHRKVYSHGSIPFSWEDIPGVRKAATPSHNQSYGAMRSPSDALDHMVVSRIPDGLAAQKFAIPPPPRMAGAPRRTSSGKGFWVREVDPFLAAYKECTKDDTVAVLPKSSGQSKKPNSKFGVRKSTSSIFSCKSSCDVNEDNFMRLTQLPPLPRSSDRINRAIR